MRCSFEFDGRRAEVCIVTSVYIIYPYSDSFIEVNLAKLGSHEVPFSQSRVLIKLAFSQSELYPK